MKRKVVCRRCEWDWPSQAAYPKCPRCGSGDVVHVLVREPDGSGPSTLVMLGRFLAVGFFILIAVAIIRTKVNSDFPPKDAEAKGDGKWSGKGDGKPKVEPQSEPVPTLSVAEAKASRSRLVGKTVRVRGPALVRRAGEDWLIVFDREDGSDGMAALDGAALSLNHAGRSVLIEVEGVIKDIKTGDGFFIDGSRVVLVGQTADGKKKEEAVAQAEAAKLERERIAKEKAEKERQEMLASIPRHAAGLAMKGKRFDASAALGKIGAPAVPALIEVFVSSKDDETRIAAAYVLAGIGPAAKEALPALRAEVKKDQDDDVNRAAKRAINAIAK